MEHLSFIANQISGAKAERITIDGKEYLRVPAVGVVEMVLNGRYLPAAEIQASLGGWDGAPIPLDHPQVNGEHVSAHHPDAQDSIVGHWGDTRADGAKLKGNLYIDLAKAAMGDAAELVRRFEAGEMVELSTAYFANEVEEPGHFNGKAYASVSRQIKPDHVALLLHKPGACSINDGCGALRLNEGVTEEAERKGIMIALFLPPEDARLLELPDEALPEGSEPLTPGQMHVTLAYLGEIDDTSADEEQVKALLARMAADTEPFKVRIGGIGRFAKESSTKNAVYAQVDSRKLMQWRERLVSDLMFDAQTMPSMRHGFTPHVTLAYVPAETTALLPPPVEREIVLDRLALSWGSQMTEFSLKPAPVQANSKEDDMDRDENTQDKGQNDSPGTKEKPPVANAETPKEEPAANTITVNAAEWAGVKDRLATLDKFLGDLGGMDELAQTITAARADHATLVANAEREKTDLVAVLVANQQELTKDDLEAMPLVALQKLARLVGRGTPAQADYSGRGLAFNAQQDEEWEDFATPTTEKQE